MYKPFPVTLSFSKEEKRTSLRFSGSLPGTPLSVIEATLPKRHFTEYQYKILWCRRTLDTFVVKTLMTDQSLLQNFSCTVRVVRFSYSR